MALPLIPNTQARRLFLDRHALIEPPSGPAKGADLAGLIARIGFVQVDSINTVERAHHMILWSRRQSYRPAALAPLLERDRSLWEHWTHDASILPMALYPMWKPRFARDAQRLHQNWRRWFRDGYEAQFDTILNRIARDGAVATSDVGEGETRSRGGWWDWHPSKTALEWLWRTGQLAITRRDGFRKVYDLAERVIPAPFRHADPDPAAVEDWACASALDHLGLATASDLAAYWNAVTVADARRWLARATAQGIVTEAEVEGMSGARRRMALRPQTLAQLDRLPEPGTRLRVLSPFDPALRDRARAEFLFGFRYRIEVFVPAGRRVWGYYVFPVLEGDRLAGRLDAKAHRAEGILRIRAYWPEAGFALTGARRQRLQAELGRLARLAGCARVEFQPGWLQISPSPGVCP